MDGLDLLKKHWDKDSNFPKINKEEIRSMLHKSSSSIVKWIFIICCLELIIMLSINGYYYLQDSSEYTVIDIIFEAIHYITLSVFIFYFLKQYLDIKNYNNTKLLSQNILKTRKLVKIFVYVNLILFTIYFFIGILNGNHIKSFEEGYRDGYEDAEGTSDLVVSNIFLWTSFIIAFIIMFLLVILYYKLVYMRLTAKLKKNYEELVALEKEE